MPAWSPDGASIYFVRTVRESGRWPSGGITRTYNLQVPTLFRMAADGSGEPDGLITGRLRRSGNTWSYFIREPAVLSRWHAGRDRDGRPRPTRATWSSSPRPPSLELTNPRPRADPGPGHQDPSWSPDGRFLLYVRNPREGARGVPRRSTATPGERPFDSRSPAAATLIRRGRRDGRFIAATRTSNFGTDVVILDGRTRRRAPEGDARRAVVQPCLVAEGRRDRVLSASPMASSTCTSCRSPARRRPGPRASRWH